MKEIKYSLFVTQYDCEYSYDIEIARFTNKSLADQYLNAIIKSEGEKDLTFWLSEYIPEEIPIDPIYQKRIEKSPELVIVEVKDEINRFDLGTEMLKMLRD